MGFQVSEEVMLAIVTAVGSFIGVILVLVQTRKNKLEGRVRLDEQRLEMERARERSDTEREARYQTQIEALQKQSDERCKELQDDLDNLTADNKVQIERRVKAETEVQQKEETIKRLDKHITMALDRLINEVKANERAQLEKARYEAENIKLNQQLEEALDQLSLIPKLQESITQLTHQLDDQKRQHRTEINELTKRINELTRTQLNGKDKQRDTSRLGTTQE